MTRIIDSHTHLYPAELAADPRAWAAARGEARWSACVGPPGRRSIQGWADADRLVADMDRAGIERCVAAGWYWEQPGTCALQNGWYQAWIRQHPDRLSALASVQPTGGAAALDDLKRCLDAGFRGIGELLPGAPGLPQAQGLPLEDERWDAVMALAGAYRVPVLFHATDPSAGPAAGPPTPLGAYQALARRHPGVTIILAHWGGGLAFRAAAPDLPERLPPNLLFDTAASPLLYDASVFRRAVDTVGADRILYGSDYPLLVHPRLEREPGFVRMLGEIQSAGLTAEERTAILSANAVRVYGL